MNLSFARTDVPWRRGLALISALVVSSCSGPRSAAERQRLWEQRLGERTVLPLNADSKVAIKRDVHNFEIDADALPLAGSFHRAMTDSTKHFGLIHIMRPTDRTGKPFLKGERFQGRYALEDWVQLHGPFWDPVLRAVENQQTSDYGEISLLNLNPPAGEDCQMTYVYLDGSPIAGSSTFVVHQESVGRSRLTQIFEYQEQDPNFVSFFSTVALRLHDEVVYSQAFQSAQAIGAHIIDTDLPKAYQLP